MAPEDLEPWLHRWRVADSPSERQQRAAEAWIDGLDEAPRQSPSRLASPDYSHPGGDEFRLAYLIDADAFVIYTVNNQDRSRLLFLGRHPPAGLDVP